MKSCCMINKKTKKCIRKKDKKYFTLPRKFSKKRCLSRPIKGFSMKSSCAPFKYCKKQIGGNNGTLKEFTENCTDSTKEQDPLSLETFTQNDIYTNNVIKVPIEGVKDKFNCFEKGSFKNYIDSELEKGKQITEIIDPLNRKVIDKQFIIDIYPEYKNIINDIEELKQSIKQDIETLSNDDVDDEEEEELYDSLSMKLKILIPKLSDPYEYRSNLLNFIDETLEDDKPNREMMVESILDSEIEDYNENQNGGKKRKTKKNKKQFLYNPNDPKRSFDVYIDKDPSDTIPIKYKTINDVKSTIKKLEKLYKQGKYPHKRIWQVGMIMKVRLEAMKKHNKKLYPNAKNVTKRFNLANQYFKFLGKRTKTQKNKRKQLSFH